jgi:hypothetical protein
MVRILQTSLSRPLSGAYFHTSENGDQSVLTILTGPLSDHNKKESLELI